MDDIFGLAFSGFRLLVGALNETCVQVFKWTCMQVEGGCKWRHGWREEGHEACVGKGLFVGEEKGHASGRA